MMNYAAAFGYLEGKIFGIAMECKYASKLIDGKDLAAKLKAAIDEATERGGNYDRDHDQYGNPKWVHLRI